MSAVYKELQTSFAPSVANHKPGQPVLEELEKEMAQFEANHEAVLDELRKWYLVPSTVRAFLNEHRAIPQLLVEAVTPFRRCFGTATVLNLEAPIDESGARTLYCVAMWSADARDAAKALDRFDEMWWIANARRGLGYLTFTYELV